jgi:hypothetical protein
VKTLKVFAAVSMVVAMGMGLTGCGVGYTGDGVVISKDVENKTSSTSTTRSSKIVYKITVDVPESDVNKKFSVSKFKYDSVQLGQNVKIEQGSVK